MAQANLIALELQGKTGLSASAEAEVFDWFKLHARDLTVSSKAVMQIATLRRDFADCWRQMSLLQCRKDEAKNRKQRAA